MRIAEIIKTKGSQVNRVAAEATLAQAAELMRSNQVGSLVVIKEGELIGILNEREIVAAFATLGARAVDSTVSATMKRDPPICDVSDTIEQVMAKMTASRARHLPVFDGNQIAGLVSIGDVVKGRLSELEHDANLVHEYVTWGR